MTKKRSLNELRQEKNYGYKQPKPEGYTEIDIDTTKELIINDLKNHFYDIIFQTVCDEMAKHEAFQEQTYFTPQGMDEFEDEWFQFYHEHHGDILGAILKHITN